MTTYEEATRCPKCEKPGEVTSQLSSSILRGTRVHTVFCRNEVCLWYDTAWLVQVNADGTIPDRNAPGARRDRKQFVPLSEESASRILQNVEQELERSRERGGETR